MQLPTASPGTAQRYRSAYRDLLAAGPCSAEELFAALVADGHQEYDTRALLSLLTADRSVELGDGVVRLSPRTFAARIEAGLQGVLLRSSRSLSRGDLVTAWRGSEVQLGSWVEDTVIAQVVSHALQTGSIVELGNTLAPGDRAALPPVPDRDECDAATWRVPRPTWLHSGPWTRTLSDLEAAVHGAVEPSTFRSLRVEAGGGVVHVASVDLGDVVALVTSSVLPHPSAGLEGFERKGWWFWAAEEPNALGSPRSRLVSQEVPAGGPFLGVHADGRPSGCARAVVLALVAHSRGGPLTLDVTMEHGPAQVGGRSAGSIAAARGGPTLRYCLRCHRPLSDPVSADRGFGPDCWDMLTGAERAVGRQMLAGLPPSRWAFPLSIEEWAERTARR